MFYFIGSNNSINGNFRLTIIKNVNIIPYDTQLFECESIKPDEELNLYKNQNLITNG
jgi:hypothetical protein